MSMNWKKAATSVKDTEYAVIENEAERRGITPSALVYAILHRVSNGFTQFDDTIIPEEMPRGFIVRRTGKRV